MTVHVQAFGCDDAHSAVAKADALLRGIGIYLAEATLRTCLVRGEETSEADPADHKTPHCNASIAALLDTARLTIQADGSYPGKCFRSPVVDPPQADEDAQTHRNPSIESFETTATRFDASATPFKRLVVSLRGTHFDGSTIQRTEVYEYSRTTQRYELSHASGAPDFRFPL